MNVVIRVDASLQMGTGHVMRCLTLADALKDQGTDIYFICREHQGNLNDLIKSKGHTVFTLPVLDKGGGVNKSNPEPAENSLFHAAWLGATQEQDAKQCKVILEEIKPNWLIVDHYAIDYRWQTALESHYKKLMVIDDLADRHHKCDLLLDQTYGRQLDDYADFVPQNCEMLLGSQYALLRPEFAEWREYSLKRRAKPQFKNLLITLGGVDPDNITAQVLEALKTCKLPKELEITVVMGATAPHKEVIKKQAERMPYKTHVKTNVSNMAELMANADVAIGAAGATTWERCCLGLPSIQIVLAENQKVIATLINKAGAALCINVGELAQLCKKISTVKNTSKGLISSSSKVTDGTGINQVLRYLK